MNHVIPFKTTFDASLISKPGLQCAIKFGTLWGFEHIRGGKIIDQWEQGNVCTSEGLTFMLNVMFHGTAAVATWYMLLFESDTTPADGTTYATPVFTEVNAKINEATRPAYVEAAASAKSITNSANKATFTFNDTDTVYGAALVGGGTDATTKADAAGGGTLFCAAKFSSSKAVVSTDVLLVTCTITLADA
jgi:hypothetical protein